MAITYNSVDDIDLYSGILSELPATGAITGPTLNCLLGENFSKIKYSDRYFYELGGQPHSFSSSTELFKKHKAPVPIIIFVPFLSCSATY